GPRRRGPARVEHGGTRRIHPIPTCLPSSRGAPRSGGGDREWGAARLTAGGRSDSDAPGAMKGILFTDFVDFVERELPAAAGHLGTEAYSPLGTYPEEDLLMLVRRAADAAGKPVDEVLRRYGTHLFRTLATLYPVFVDGVGSALDLLAGI